MSNNVRIVLIYVTIMFVVNFIASIVSVFFGGTHAISEILLMAFVIVVLVRMYVDEKYPAYDWTCKHCSIKLKTNDKNFAGIFASEHIVKHHSETLLEKS